MPFIIAILVGVAAALLRGGRPGNLANLSIRWSVLPLVAMGLQLYVLRGPGKMDADPFSAPALAMLASYGLVWVTVLLNRQLPGMIWLGVGATLNLLVIVANGGWMPVTPELLATAGYITSPSAVTPGQRWLYSKDIIETGESIRLGFLADRFVIPRAGILTAVFSLGDVFMMFGLAYLVYSQMLGQTGYNRNKQNSASPIYPDEPEIKPETASWNR